ncbi:efflux RND transporter periplasmic adaptor subunit [Marinivivus vitaminiproducens]|uniref:efflux RND transporter periplasmic adaptor subunit n=1 Tax=Marinivivus vitaminiproducens TaxID=3035935 RepID=UPI0027A8DCDE|nr:efflux RND transporter periplasmic adaptor subunit [Geminicoccaceae bacterium SCSIO 64248]
MRLSSLSKPAVLATLMGLGLAAWLLSGQLGADPAADAPSETAAPERAPFRVAVGTFAPEPVRREVVAMGYSAPARRVELRSETVGRVDEIGVTRGQVVSKGDLILRLAPDDREAALREAEALVAQRELEAHAARTLGQRGFSAETAVAEAEALLAAARARRDLARIELERTAILAPFDGILEERTVEIGDFIEIADPVATVIEQDPFLVVAEVPETTVHDLEVGQNGTAKLSDGRTVEGRLRYVASEAREATRTFKVELEVPNPSQRFISQSSAELSLVVGETEAVPVPTAFLVLDESDLLGVYAVDDKGIVRFHSGDIVRADTSRVWLAGLPGDLRIITRGQGFVREGDEVEAVEAPPAKDAGA